MPAAAKKGDKDNENVREELEGRPKTAVFLGKTEVDKCTAPDRSVTFTTITLGGGLTVGKNVMVDAVMRGLYVLAPISDRGTWPRVGNGADVSNR